MTTNRIIASAAIALFALLGFASTAQAAPVCGSTPQSCSGYKEPGMNDYQKKLAAKVQADNKKLLKQIHDKYNPDN